MFSGGIVNLTITIKEQNRRESIKYNLLFNNLITHRGRIFYCIWDINESHSLHTYMSLIVQHPNINSLSINSLIFHHAFHLSTVAIIIAYCIEFIE